MNAEDILDVFALAAAAQRESLRALVGSARRARTDVAGQYHLDTVADAAILPVLHEAGVKVLSEESGWTGDPDAAITVVLDPVDGSTNCARDIPYWGISACALDADGLTAVDGHGAHLLVRGEFLKDGCGLQREFARGAEDQRLRLAVVGVDLFNDRYRECRGFARARLRNADEVAASQKEFEALLLNRGRGFVARFCQRLLHFRG